MIGVLAAKKTNDLARKLKVCVFGDLHRNVSSEVYFALWVSRLGRGDHDGFERRGICVSLRAFPR
jgi:hypothetical protein